MVDDGLANSHVKRRFIMRANHWMKIGGIGILLSITALADHGGKLQVEVQGLLLTTGAPPNLVGTVGPVKMVGARMACP